MKKLLLSALLTLCAGCLVGCVGHGTRTITIEAFGQSIVIKDEVSLDENGKTEWARGFDESGWKLVFGWVGDLFAPDTTPEAEVGDVGTEDPEPN